MASLDEAFKSPLDTGKQYDSNRQSEDIDQQYDCCSMLTYLYTKLCNCLCCIDATKSRRRTESYYDDR